MSPDPVPITTAMHMTVDQLISARREGSLPIEAPDPDPAPWNSEQGLTRRNLWRDRIPARFRDAHLDDYTTVSLDLDVTEWVKARSGQNLVILGPVGVGKTHLAVAACRDRHLDGELVRFWPVVELLDALRPGGNDDAAANAVTTPLLILDDLGAERPTDWTAERLYALINRRWLSELPTVVTSNLPPGDLGGAIGERLYSRLAHEAVAVTLTGADRRRP